MTDAQALRSIFVIDGFPRTLDNVEEFEKQIGRCQQVLYLECPDAVMKQRLSARAQSGSRTDDTPTIIENRIKVFHRETMPVIDLFRSDPQRTLLQVDASKQLRDVYKDVEQQFDSFLANCESRHISCT